MDTKGTGVLDVNTVRRFYNAEKHPDVKSLRKSEEEVLQEFLETFEAHKSMAANDDTSKKGDAKVTLNEFMDYYSNVSASIDDDQYFALMMTNAWNLDDK